MSRYIGIDLGTTNSAVAVVDSGIPYLVADAEGDRLTPSIVHYSGGGEDPWVGVRARNVLATSPQSTITSVKRLVGRRASEMEDIVTPYSVVADEDGMACVQVGERILSPEEVSAEILKHLQAVAERELDGEVEGAVITVPAYFNDAQRTATKRAGELAGLKVERIINEPTAAALAYGLDRLKEKSRIAVYDLGGGTFDLSILELNEGVFQVLSTNGNTCLGGDDIDHAIANHLEKEIVAQLGSAERLDAVAHARIREAAEAAKKLLPTDNSASISLPFLSAQFSYEEEFSREQLDRLARPIIERTRRHCLRSLADAKLEATDLNQVILVGGQTRMPLVRSLVANWFQCAEFEEERGGLRIGEDFHQDSGPQLNTSQNPDEAVALGAAIQSEILAGGFKDMLLLDVTPLSLGIETFGGLMNVIIPRNSTIPIKAGEQFTTAVDHQREMLIHVLQGERERAKDNWSLGRFTIEFEKAARAVPRVGVQFEIDADGILHVLARDIKTGTEKIVDLQSAVDVEDADVQQMVEESVEHAFDDLRARQWVEARLKAEATLEAAEKGLSECAAEMPDEVREAVQAAMTDVKAALAEEVEGTDVGPLEKLKSAHTVLDETSQPLAGLLMERAMDEMLKRRGLIS